jgi:hypothetical protein
MIKKDLQKSIEEAHLLAKANSITSSDHSPASSLFYENK